jgi:hypothetical protein
LARRAASATERTLVNFRMNMYIRPAMRLSSSPTHQSISGRCRPRADFRDGSKTEAAPLERHVRSTYNIGSALAVFDHLVGGTRSLTCATERPIRRRAVACHDILKIGCMVSTAIRSGSACPRYGVRAGGEAGVDFFGIERCDRFGSGKPYGRASLVADLRHAAR